MDSESEELDIVGYSSGPEIASGAPIDKNPESVAPGSGGPTGNPSPGGVDRKGGSIAGGGAEKNGGSKAKKTNGTETGAAGSSEPPQKKRRGRPPGSGNKRPRGGKTEGGPAQRAAPAPVVPAPAAVPQEPLTKRAKLLGDVNLEPAPLARNGGDASAKAVAVKRPRAVAAPRPAVAPPLAAKEKPTPPALAALGPPAVPPAADQPLGETQKSAYDEWLEANATVEPEAPLIEEIAEVVQYQPSAEELLGEKAIAAFEALLPRLESSKESIGIATTAALAAAAAGKGPRAVRAVIDAVLACPNPRDRVRYLYLLDSSIKQEVRLAKTGGASGAPAFPRAVGAALPRLVGAMLGDADVLSRVETVLGVWRSQEFVSQALVDAALAAVAADRAALASAAVGSTEAQLQQMVRETSLNATLSLTFTLEVSQCVKSVVLFLY